MARPIISGGTPPLSIRLAVALAWVFGAGWTAIADAEGLRDRLEGLVFEAEDWSTPKDAWLKNTETADHWNLWTTEADSINKRSMGAVLRTPTARADRDMPEDGAPPLHTHITGIPEGVYRVFMNHTGRHLAYALDGRQWIQTSPRGEVPLGVFEITDGTFDVWVDDRYATPSNIGPAYYDYIRMVPYEPPVLTGFDAFRMADGRVQVSWVSSEMIDTGVLEVDTGSGFSPVAKSDERALRNHRVWVKGWVPGQRVRVRVNVPVGRDFAFISPEIHLEVPGDSPAVIPEERSIPLALAAPVLPDRPVLAGVPLERQQLWSAEHVWGTDGQGAIPSQVNVAARWPDGSVKWLFTCFMADAKTAGLHVRLGNQRPECRNGFRIDRTSDQLSIDNGTLRLVWQRDRFALFDQVHDTQGLRFCGKSMLGNVRVVDREGCDWGLGCPERWVAEESGPVRSVILCEGPFCREDGVERFRYRIRYFLTMGSPVVRVQLTLINDSPDPAYQELRSFAVRVPLAGEEWVRGRLAGVDEASIGKNHSPYEVLQISSDKARVIAGGETGDREGYRGGWAVANRGPIRIAVAIRDFSQTWPKGIAIKPDGLHVRMLPELTDHVYPTQSVIQWMRHYYWFKEGRYLFKRGMALRTEFWVRFDRASDTIPMDDWQQWAESLFSLPYACPDPIYSCGSGAWGPVQPASHDARPEYERMVGRNVERILENRRVRSEYGWMNFGDWHGERAYNWGNSEYDLGWAMALQFVRTGRWDCFEIGEQMTRHYTTIDTVHVPLSDAMAGRVYAHSVGHVGSGFDPGRAGPDDGSVRRWISAGTWNDHFFKGVIDTGGHIYQEGNFAYYFLTGDRDYLDAGEMVVAAQAAYLTQQFDFGIERAAGWPMINALAAYDATGNPFYLNAARLYVEKVLMKQDPVGGGWLLPQPASECSTGKTGLGGKAFATGVLLYGLMRYDLVEPREDVKQSIVRACEWLVEQMWNSRKRGFRYKTGCDDYIDNADDGTAIALCLPGLAYGWKLSGDPRFQAVLAEALPKMCELVGDIGKQATMLCRQSAYALPLISRAGATSSP